ncbi:hypothetical protein DENSPDRAFT_429943 [Dentipellis sp. KUC8613]|nr:hypothetical protein DENSPDRAFT_429943 [Dentipellis sp. KUC8613]
MINDDVLRSRAPEEYLQSQLRSRRSAIHGFRYLRLRSSRLRTCSDAEVPFLPRPSGFKLLGSCRHAARSPHHDARSRQLIKSATPMGIHAYVLAGSKCPNSISTEIKCPVACWYCVLVGRARRIRAPGECLQVPCSCVLNSRAVHLCICAGHLDGLPALRM